MSFYFYAYYRNPKVTLHRGDCSFCNHGQGIQARKHTNLTGRWLGAYPSFELALGAAQHLGQVLGVSPTYCQRCIPV